MDLHDYLSHYLQPGPILLMLLSAAVVISVCLAILYVSAKRMSRKYTPETQQHFIHDEMLSLTERFYELIFSATSILLFVGIYFLIDFLGVGASYREVWDKYSSILLLVFILASICLNSFIDNLIIPLYHVRPGERASMRLIGMLYMLLIFAYIKYIYLDNNYDSIILYFLTLVIGRFVYFDASVENFHNAMSAAFTSLPLLVLALLSTGVMAFVGFSSGYLLRSNGVVLSLFLAHLFLLAVIFIVHRLHLVQRLTGRGAARRR